jgi:hypothetical protein
MGTVHGVYLKYVGLSALSCMGYAWCAARDSIDVAAGQQSQPQQQQHERVLTAGLGGLTAFYPPDHLHARGIAANIFGYSALLNGVIAILFKTERGMGLIGKDRATGRIPWWSYVVWFPFHLPTRLYTHFHTRMHQPQVPVASQVQPGWWVGGCYGHELTEVTKWAAVIDLTVEFPETATTDHYLSIPTWDGVPATPAQLEQGATFAVQHMNQGPILVHCAHGRGRSTTMMCACLVKANLYPDWQEAFEKGVKPGRNVCKLNRRMKQALAAWQAEYVDGKKGQ